MRHCTNTLRRYLLVAAFGSLVLGWTRIGISAEPVQQRGQQPSAEPGMEGLVYKRLGDRAFLITEGFTYSTKVQLGEPMTYKVADVKGVTMVFESQALFGVPNDAVGITWLFDKPGLSIQNNGHRYTAVVKGATVEFRKDGVIVRGFKIEKLKQ